MAKNTKKGAPLGNQNGVKLRTPALRKMAHQSYCRHLAAGKSKKSWFFEHPEISLTWETMEDYLQDRIEFDPIHKKIAECKGFAYWEEVVEQSATGKNKANTASLQMLMRNKFSWDSKEVHNNDAEKEKRADLEQLARAIGWNGPGRRDDF